MGGGRRRAPAGADRAWRSLRAPAAQIALFGVYELLLRRSRFLEFTSSCCADRAWFPEVPPGHIRSARGLDSASLHLARGASPYGKRQSPSRLCASTTRLGDCLLPHCSLPIRTVYHNPPQKPMNFFLLLPVLPPPLPSLPLSTPLPHISPLFSPPFSPQLHISPSSSHFPPSLSTILPPPSYPILSLLFFPFSTSSSYLFPSHSRFPSLLFLHPSFSPPLHLPPFPTVLSPILTSLSRPHPFPISLFLHPSFSPPFHSSSAPTSLPHVLSPILSLLFLPPLLPPLFSHIPPPIPTYHIPPPRPHHILPFLPPTAYGFQNIRQL